MKTARKPSPMQEVLRFDGKTFDARRDGKRLTTLLGEVRMLVRDGKRRTLGEIHAALGRGSEASISARLRDLRKPRFGGWEVHRALRGPHKDGLWEYWIDQPVLEAVRHVDCDCSACLPHAY